jgi:threonine/homoserine/homoserine lactone efflux protein
MIGVAFQISDAMAVFETLVVAAAICGLLYLGWRLWREHRTKATELEHHRAELAARADVQHRWYMAGYLRGTYGRYPPAVARSAVF